MHLIVHKGGAAQFYCRELCRRLRAATQCRFGLGGASQQPFARMDSVVERGQTAPRFSESRHFMDKSDRTEAMARRMWDARQRRETFCNLPDELRPASIAEAYVAQEAYYRLAEPVYGAVAGAKIATTTKVMQRLMGINHACGGAIFARTIHHSPAKLRGADFVNLRIESEIALQLGADLPASRAPWTSESVASAVAGAMPAFELIEARGAG